MSENNNNLRTNFRVFGYGSLMWDNWETQFQGTCEGKAILRGFYRAFNKKSTRNWGSNKIPCPTLGLEKSNGTECIGLVFKFNSNQKEEIIAFLKDREGPSFQLVEVEIELEDGQKEIALTPINSSERSTYIGNLSLNKLIEMVQKASGKDGSCIEYIRNLHKRCEELSISDEYVEKLWEGINQGVPTKNHNTSEMSIQPERSLEDVLLDIMFEKFPDIVKDDDIHSIEFIKEFLQDDENIDFFLENIKNIYSEGDYPHYNLAPILSIIAEILNKREEPLKSKLYSFTLDLLDSSIENLIILGFDIFSENRRLFWDKRTELYSIILDYWDSPNEKLRAEAIYSLQSYVYIDFKYFSPHFNKLKRILIESENVLVIISSTLILGLIYLYNHRSSNILSLSIEEVNHIISKYELLDSIAHKSFFLNDLHILLLDYDKYESDWIDFLLTEYKTIDNLDYRFKLLRDIASFPNKKEFKKEDSKKYYDFFHKLLDELLREDFEKPPPSVLVTPNHLQDVLHNTEQLAFYLPEVMEELLPLYEEVYSKYVPIQVNSGLSFERLAHQWIQEIYIILSDYHKRKKSYKKSSLYYKKVAEYAFNDKQELEFLIKHYQAVIGYEIKDHNFVSIKQIFNEMNEIFEKYKEKFNQAHICYPNWLVFEDLIHICDCSEEEYPKKYRTLKEHLINNKDQISEEIASILNEIGVIKGKELKLNITDNYSECDELRIHILNSISEILEQILEIKSPLVKKLIEEIIKSQEMRVKDVSQKRAVQLIDKDRKEKGIPEIKNENAKLWEDVINFLDTLDMEQLFPNELPHEDDINEKICELLKKQFPNVIHKKLISGKIHIDLSVDSKIIIETKKIPSETYRQFLISQVSEDIRITGNHFGIAFGIDTSATKELLRYNRLSYLPEKSISQVIKPYNLKKNNGTNDT